MGLEQIGQKLKTAREGQGLSLPQVFERTKIPINHLQSIENGQLEDLPEPVYVSGFLKRYGDCVGLNGQSLSDEYRKQNGNAAPTTSGENHQSWTPRMMSAPQPAPNHNYMRGGIDVRPPNILKQGLLYSVLIVMVLGIMSLLFTWQSNYQNNNQQDTASSLLKNGRYTGVFNNGGTQAAPQAAAAVTPQVVAPADPNAVGDAQPTAPTADQGASVAINASQHVWVEITAVSTGQSLYTGFMERGERKDFKDPQGLRVHAGNGASITTEAEGKNETLGLPGKIAEKVFMGKSPAVAGAMPPGTTIPMTPEAKAAAAAAALKTAAVKKAIKKTASLDVAPRRHSRPAEDVSAHSSAPAASIDVPYRYTESHSDNE